MVKKFKLIEDGLIHVLTKKELKKFNKGFGKGTQAKAVIFTKIPICVIIQENKDVFVLDYKNFTIVRSKDKLQEKVRKEINKIEKKMRVKFLEYQFREQTEHGH